MPTSQVGTPTPVSATGYKAALQENGEKMNQNLIVRKQFAADEIKAVGDDTDRKLQFTISTQGKDRDGDVIRVDGWVTDHYMKNPVVLFAHDSHRPPIGRAAELTTTKRRLKAVAEFMGPEIDTSGFSDMIFRMVKNKFLNATSVGFKPIDFEWIEEEDDDRDFPMRTGIKFLKQELLEFSVVPVPSNPEALIMARSKGIDTAPLEGWFEQALDEWANYKDLLLLPKADVQEFYKASRRNGRVFEFIKRLGEEEAVTEEKLAHDATGATGEESIVDKEVKDVEPEKVAAAAETKQSDELVAMPMPTVSFELSLGEASIGMGAMDVETLKALMDGHDLVKSMQTAIQAYIGKMGAQESAAMQTVAEPSAPATQVPAAEEKKEVTLPTNEEIASLVAEVIAMEKAKLQGRVQ